MDWITGMQRAIDYIEAHIEGELQVSDIAREAACSVYYFQKLFGILCGVSLGEYIRNRRLTLAGSALIGTDKKVIDVALQYGYESPESFTRAFSNFHGITPSEARRNGAKLRSFSRLSVQIILKGGSHMNYKIVEKQAFRVLEKVELHSITPDENGNTIPAFWERARTDGTMETLLQMATDNTLLFGICYGNEATDGKTFPYSIAVPYDGEEPAPEGFRVREIPAATWAVFSLIGAMPDAIQNAWQKICAEFLPTSGYRQSLDMDMEVYPDGDMSSPTYQSEIWLPVEK